MEDSVIIWVVIALTGASIGSFLTLISYRLPRGLPVGMERSRCTSCGVSLTLRDLVPVFSWAANLARCRHCKAKVSWRYPLMELVTAAGTLAAAAHYGFTLEALAIAGLWWCIVAIVVVDLEHYIILDEVQVAVILFGAFYHYALGTDAVSVISAGFTGLAIGLTLKYGFLYLRNKDGLGLGDVKLLFGCGIWLASIASFVPYLFYSGLLGIAFGLLWRCMKRGEVFPFGPALMASLLLCVVWPQAASRFWQLYGLIGN